MPNRLIISPTKQVIEERPQIIRIAMHPRPSRSNKGSKTNDNYTKDSAYEIPTYTELIPKLEKLSTTTALA